MSRLAQIITLNHIISRYISLKPEQITLHYIASQDTSICHHYIVNVTLLFHKTSTEHHEDKLSVPGNGNWDLIGIEKYPYKITVYAIYVPIAINVNKQYRLRAQHLYVSFNISCGVK